MCNRSTPAAATAETLESRRLLSALLANGVLTIVGTDRADRIEVMRRDDQGQIRVELNGTRTRFPLGDVTRVQVSGRGGHDLIEFSGRDGGVYFPANVSGGKGNDTIRTGLADDTVSGGNGHDRIEGDAGDDLISGGNGDDVIEGGDGNDTLRGDAGNDILHGNHHNDRLAGGAGDDDLFGGHGIDSVWGNAGDDDFGPDRVLEIKDHDNDDRGNNINR
jgi:Ca2+-binding RTX toxin-like protein